MVVTYKGCILHKNSTAYELYQTALKTGNYYLLDAHMRQLDKNEKELLQRYK